MKKLTIILTILLCFTFVSCNGDVTEPPAVSKTEEPTVDAPTEEGYYLVLKDTKIAIDGDMKAITDALGEPTSYFESNSCAFQGLDKVYTWGSVTVRTYPEDDGDCVLSIELKDDSVSTPEGIGIGDSDERVEELYGTPDKTTDVAKIYTKGNTDLTFLITNGEVTAITYTQKS